MMEERQKKIRSVTYGGMVLNVFLAAVKLAVGVLVRSSALIADGIHSVSDLATDLVVLVGTRLSSQPADECHPYGHSKLETLASQIIALFLLLVSIGLIWSAGAAIYNHEINYPGYPVLLVAAVSVVSKEIIFHLTRKVSRVVRSSALYANAWHHRSDSLSSIAVLLGGTAGLLGWGYADHASTIAVGFMIIGVALKIFYEGFVELSEHAADRESVETIEKTLSGEEDIRGWHALRTRKLGAELFIDVHILVDPALSVVKGHEITVHVENKIRRELSRPANILIHIEPDLEEMRRAGGHTDSYKLSVEGREKGA